MAAQHVPSSFEEFEKINKIYALNLEFPVSELEQLERKINSELKREGQTTTLTKDDVAEIIGRAIISTHSMVQHLERSLDDVQNMLAANHLPRLDRQKQTITAQATNQHQRNFEVPQWMKDGKFDIAADPKYRNQAIIAAADAVKAQEFTPGFRDQLKNTLQAEARYRLALRMAPRPSPYQKPKPSPV